MNEQSGKLAVNLDNYAELAGRTNSKFPDGKSLNSTVVGNMLSACGGVARAAKEVDGWKRHIYYGKAAPDLLYFGDVTQYEIKLTEAQVNLLHGALGCVTEAGELLDSVLDHLFDGDSLDVTNLKEEVGDMQWYQALILSTIGVSLQAALEANIDKLRARYGDKFSQEAALNRDLNKERMVLEAK